MKARIPADFVWGVATSAYQIEGAHRQDGKGESIWDRFVRGPGRIQDGATGDVACDHYHRWREDVELMADLGISAYRFSIAWTRVFPDGDGRVNSAGLGFYDALVDGLAEKGIQPWVTLYHWDLPQALQERGGWPARATVDAFVGYAETVAGALGDRVSNWITQNEPWVAAILGHQQGVFAPGLRDWGAALAAGHHLLLSHGKATQAIRARAPGARVGIAIDCRPNRAASPEPADVAAARHFDGFRNRWFFDPVFGKGYPQDMLAAYHDAGRIEASPSFLRPGDLETIGTPIDFLGLNYYTSLAVGAGSEETEDSGVPPGPSPPPGYTEMGWEVTPAALGDFLRRVRDEYAPSSIVITENGASYSERPGEDGIVRDQRRIAYLQSHLEQLAVAREAGVPVDGYFVWSLLDNFEWALGYSQLFGLVWVDRDTLKRVPKQSFDFFRHFIAAQRGN